MPFFEQIYKNKQYKKQKNVTLQVRIVLIEKKICRKRVLPSASHRASMTVEAALVLPLFLFAAVMMTMPFSIMNRERQVQAVVESVAEDICQLAYKSHLSNQKETVGQMAWNVYAQLQVGRKLNHINIQNLSLRESELLEDGETVKLIVHYQLPLPFPIFRMKSVSRTNGSYRRAWVGKEGGYMGGEQGDADKIVYIGKSSTRYHISRTCHYLYNQLSKVWLKDIDEYRNSSGDQYKSCIRCSHGGSETVYIMPSGKRYHSTMSCSAIAAYVKAVKKSEVAQLGACSYCSGG